MEERIISLKVTETIERDIQEHVLRSQVRGLDVDECRRLGIYNRISLLLCGMHTLNMVANRLWGHVQYLLDVMQANAKEIKRANNQFQRAFDGYIRFWSDYYAGPDANREMNDEMEAMYHQFMKWAQLPESWKLGDAQHTEDPVDTMLEVNEDSDDRTLRFFRSVVNVEPLADTVESWLVTRMNRLTKEQAVVEEHMDRASAMMVAKRMSKDDRESIYTASMEQTLTERRTEILPMKAYKAGMTVGDAKKIIRKP